MPLVQQQTSKGNPKLGIAQVRYGALLADQGEAQTAREQFTAGLDKLATAAGRDHPHYARAQLLYAQFQVSHDEPAAALETLDQSLPVLTRVFGEQHEFVWLGLLMRGLALHRLEPGAQSAELLTPSLAALSGDRFQAKYPVPIQLAREVLGGG